MNARPVVLWCCAAILGIAAGLNYARVYGKRASQIRAESSRSGFDSPGDYAAMNAMLNTPRLPPLDDLQIVLLSKYATKKGVPQLYVAGILEGVTDEPTAERLVPVAGTLFKLMPNHPIVQEAPDVWDRNGCHVAAKMLRDLAKAK